MDGCHASEHVAETGSFTAAAERLGRTQAAVSMAIAKWRNDWTCGSSSARIAGYR
ncbi:helix-turn-helix domain-containing protein [Sinorhizobium meliloti]|uniref:helix-turn-helix domain-containing protein n=1 Tax=Rhizobium meliloti TaxID=382 RepID=UPI001F363B95|nr:LysR family transcriptional regulator [Sinorhizobium meliloti]